MDWIKRFIRNSDKVKAYGDPYTVKLTQEYGGMAMPQHDLSDCEIEKLVEYIEWANENSE